MDYVYLCREGDNEELRYSIRSVMQNGSPDNIWVVGGKPDWYSGNFIEVDQDKNKFENQVKSLKHVCANANISSDFILMNDDFYIFNKIEKNVYYDGLLIDKIEKHILKNGNSSYARSLKSAFKVLKGFGINDPLNYDIHTPMEMNKDKLSTILDLSLSPRSLYGNFYNIGGTQIKDVKIYKDAKDVYLNEYIFISTEDNSFNLIKNNLKEMFKESSIFEKK